MTQVVSEPWLRGDLQEVHPLVRPAFFSFAQVREDLDKHVSVLSDEQVWRAVSGTSVGFHVKHLAGSVDRLTTYLSGEMLTDAQLEALRNESSGTESVEELLGFVDEALRLGEQRLLAVDPATAYEVRTVGRKRLLTSVLGLIVHVCEHTQRHLGQAITTAKFVRDSG